jgi:hypothetical protein
MGRLRARFATTPLDARVQSRVGSAEGHVQAALREVRRARASREIDTRRALRVERDLGRVLAAMSNVGRVGPLRDVSDPDLMPEREREALWREDLERRRIEEEEASAAEVEEIEAPEPEPEPEVIDG